MGINSPQPEEHGPDMSFGSEEQMTALYAREAEYGVTKSDVDDALNRARIATNTAKDQGMYPRLTWENLFAQNMGFYLENARRHKGPPRA